VPVAGAAVQLSAHGSATTQTAVTDEKGRFTAGPFVEWHLFYSLLGDPLYAFSINIATQGRDYNGYKGGGVGYAPREIELLCDLAHPTGPAMYQVFCDLKAGALMPNPAFQRTASPPLN